jgi:hypothetical protein
MTDMQVAALAICLQAALAIGAARRTHQAGDGMMGLVASYAAVRATMSVRLTVGKNPSAGWFVPVVAVIAVQIATLPDQAAIRQGGDSEDVRTLRIACRFVAVGGRSRRRLRRRPGAPSLATPAGSDDGNHGDDGRAGVVRAGALRRGPPDAVARRRPVPVRDRLPSRP